MLVALNSKLLYGCARIIYIYNITTILILLLCTALTIRSTAEVLLKLMRRRCICVTIYINMICMLYICL